MSALPLIYYDLISPIFSSHLLDTYLLGLLLGFEIMCVKGSAHAVC